MPLQKKLKARSVSPRKGSASGSTSPTKEVDDELENVVAPASMNIDLDEARKATNEFKSSCLNRATSCAVSGEGVSWCPGPPIGPGIRLAISSPSTIIMCIPLPAATHMTMYLLKRAVTG
ncbi:hypothetical protein FMUND_15808 [Fusarium mundagurra]|uniref:Uncharacterized protein n=1 Tax=Fusarium mundagurra TaxID=1567541 RepID=A0A8H6CWW7_9HYPO|nr:hypothetical protein FMUND_15808 [Fusarium mundagurra]